MIEFASTRLPLLGLFLSLLAFSALAGESRAADAESKTAVWQQIEDSGTGMMLLRVLSRPPSENPEPSNSFGSKLPGWPVTVTEQVDASPAVGDLDGDGDLEVIFGDIEGFLSSLHHDGTPLAGWPRFEGGPRTSVALARFYPSDPVEILTGTPDLDLLVPALTALRFDGTTRPGWPVPLASRFFLAPPSAVDLDGDGIPEAVTSPEGYAFAIRADGTHMPGWPVEMDFGFAFPIKPAAVGDVDRDGSPEVFIGAQDRKLYGWDAGGSRLPGYPLALPGRLNGGVILADFDADGDLEIGVTTDLGWIYLLEADGTVFPGWPQQTCCITNAGLSVGDFDGDGQLEVATATTNLGDSSGSVYVWHTDGSLKPGWPREVPLFSFNASPILVDVDGDGVADVVAGGATASFASRGRIYAWRGNGTPIEGFPIILPNAQTIFSSVITAADLDQDGTLDLLVGSNLGFNPGPGQVHAFDLDVPYDPTTFHWPTQSHDFQRTSRYTPPPRRVEVEMAMMPPRLDLEKPRNVRIRVGLPEDLRGLGPSFVLTRIDGRPVQLEGEAFGPPAGSGPVRLTEFDGKALAELIEETLDPVPASVRLDFGANTEPALAGWTSLELR
jgi:FG-GAP-like repeat